jgi:hypothetical protein
MIKRFRSRGKAIMRCAVLTLVMFCALPCGAQIALRTYVTQSIARLDGPYEDNGDWSFTYNDAGQLDSLRYNGVYIRELGGLSKMKPFIREVYDWENLPPNTRPFSHDFTGSLRMVITESIPGKIQILQWRLHGRDSLEKLETINYEYDVRSRRLLAARNSRYVYEDSAGFIRGIKVFSGKWLRAVWELHRDVDGVVIGITHRRALRDTLVNEGRYQVLKWQDQIADNSVKGESIYESLREEFPWLPEGAPAVWIRWTWNRVQRNWQMRTLTEKKYDNEARLIHEEGKDLRKIDYYPDGAIWVERREDPTRPEMWTRGLRRFGKAKNVIWEEAAMEIGGSNALENRFHSFRYETSYRYQDSLWGDRFAPDLLYRVNIDTVVLRITEPRSTIGLTAYLIDTTENEIEQIQLTGRKTIYILPKRDEKMYYAIRWKYKGRKIVDQAF